MNIQNKFKLDFVGIGFPRSGSTWLYEVLRKHPQICMSKQKELFYFCKDPQWGGFSHYKLGDKWLQSNFSKSKPHQKRGEITPLYISDPASPALIKQSFPDIKILINYRNPTERMYSLYYMMAAIYPVADTFESFLEEDKLTLRTGFSYKLTQNFLDHFPIEQFKFVLLEDIKSNPLKVMREVYQFLDVDPQYVPPQTPTKASPRSAPRSILLRNLIGGSTNLIKRNSLSHQINSILVKLGVPQVIKWLTIKNYKEFTPPAMKEETRRHLISLFAEDNLRLGEFLNRDLSHWNE